MAFLNPNLALLGIGFLIIPILIVLFIHRRRLVLRWAAYHWMELALAKKRRKLRVTELLKLLSKLLLILALALALGRPMLKVERARRTLLVVDHSPSMQTRLGEATRMDRARELARRLVDASDGPVAIATLDDHLTPLSQFQEDRQALGQLISTIAPSTRGDTARSLIDGVLAYPSLSEVEQLVIISDFQAQWYGEPEALSELASRLGADRPVQLVPVDSRTGLANVGVVESRLPPEGMHRGRENEIQVLVRNFGAAAVMSLPVTLANDGRAQDRALVDLPPGEAKWVHLSSHNDGFGPQQLAISVPPDTYPVDDVLLLAVAPLRPRNILGVIRAEHGRDGPEPDVFFRSALNAVGGTEQWNYRTVRPEQLATENPANYDVIVLFGVPVRTGDSHAEDLRTFVERGGGMIAFDDGQTEGIWTALGMSCGDISETVVTPDRGRLGDGCFGFMADSPELAPDLIHFYRWRSVTAAGDTRALLHVTGATDPVVVRKTLGTGAAICAGFGLYPGATDLYYNPNVVQFCARLVWDVLADDPVRVFTASTLPGLRVPGLDRANRYALADAKGVHMPLRVQGTPRRPELSIPTPPEAGFYAITQGDRPVLRFAYNVTRTDSDIRTAAVELADSLEDEQVSHKGQVGILTEGQFGKMTSTRELLVAAFVLLACAVVLENVAHFVLGSRR
ncbi:MAG: hypothetical protein HN742_36370 [Lentisphaerae bacterium]|jgi:hypothetical protein|nr:hypothetical protein [Lentisphaerota bacterium]MBT4820689.1 hypothetical protein [Lentisphaerota bacterium]MBT5610615.1 hypothetical protein [Lentisphaerota bacterium]MBT7053862.1 hypothetical protein [Lentisphaerota bacterium]MBT7847400.1 hypothetical protein [Lentisphaerota bacterium]